MNCLTSTFILASVVFFHGPGLRAEPPPPDTVTPAEETRLSPALFREGLKKRGLIELLEQHLQEFPPASPSAAALMNREVKLAEFADKTRTLDQRRAAIAEANRLLEQLISENSDDPRAIEWRLTLAHSLLYQEGESYAMNLLYFEGSQADRRLFAPLAARALSVLRSLIGQLDAENKRVDDLSAAEFERLEKSGAIEKLDRIKPAAEYLLLWALFYDSLPRDYKDPVRARQLSEILKVFNDNPEWLTTPQEKSHVQIPALLLAGMTKHRLEDYVSARQYFERAAAAVQRLADEAEKDAVQWAITLTALEGARNAREEGRFDAALQEITSLRSSNFMKTPAQFGARLAAALVERSILQARADSAEKAGRSTDARKLREDAWRSLAALAAEEPENRPQLYATLYRSMVASGDSVARRDPMEMCAWLAGLLAEASQDESKKAEILSRALREAEQYLAQAEGTQRIVTPEILFQMGVIHHRLEQPAAASEKMLEIAKRYPNYGQAGQAAVTAVQLAAQLCMDASHCAAGSPNQELYRKTLETLLEGYPNLGAAHYWQFYYAQLLEDAEDFSGAAEAYARVSQEHEHYLEAAYRRVRACARAAAQGVAREPGASASTLINVNAVATAYRDLVTRVTALGSEAHAKHSQDAQDLLAQARLWLAEAYLLAGVNRADQALELLSDFESTFGKNTPHLGRLWQARLRALEALGRLDDASQAVPEYIAADPRSAGPTLQLLYDSMLAEWRRQPRGSDGQPAKFNSEIMLLIADQIVRWTQRTDVSVTPARRRDAAIQNAEAHLFAGHFAKARDLFLPLLPAAQSETARLDSAQLRVIYGHALALLREGDPGAALPEFNRLATALPPDHPLRWQALLGDLECRTALNHPPDGILRVIAQQRRLFPDLGGPESSAAFERLERENIRRRDQHP